MDIQSIVAYLKSSFSIINYSLFRYMAIGIYVGAATVGGAAYWFMFDPTGPQMSYWQLSNHMTCYASPEDFKGISCEIFQVILKFLYKKLLLESFNTNISRQFLTTQ